MQARVSHLVMLGGSLAFLASLFLTWISSTPPAGGAHTLFASGGFLVNGWGTTGQAAAIAAVALALIVLVSFWRPELEHALPFGGCAITLATLALVDAADLRTEGIFRAGIGGAAAHLGTGAYVGGAAAFAALLGAALASRDELAELGNATVAAAVLLTAGLVAANVLPTLNVHPYSLRGTGGYQFVSVQSSGTAIMLLIASIGLTFWFGAGPPLRRLSTAAVILVLTVGGFSTLGTHVHWPYEAWLAIGCAAGLLVLAAATSGLPRVARPTRQYALAFEGAVLLFASLFFNWQRSCAPHTPGGTCFVSNGWGGGLTGGLVAIFVVLLLGFRRLAPELAVAVAIYVAAFGFSVTEYGNLSLGAFLGFASTALLLLAVGLGPWNAVRAGARLVPVAACLAFLAIPVATLSGRLSPRIELFGSWELRFLEAAAIIVALRLIGRWLSGPADDELLLLPIALLAFTGFELGEMQHVLFIDWEGWLALALALLLVALGWLGRSGGLDIRLPEEIWRVDRISAGEN